MTDNNTTKTATPKDPNKMTAPAQMPDNAARAVFADFFLENEGKTFAYSAIAPLLKKVGYSRRWAYKVLAEFETSGLLRRDNSGEKLRWTVTNDDKIMMATWEKFLK